MKVFLTSKPQAIISLALEIAILLASSTVRSFHRNFSSSVSCITSGTSKRSCIHLVKIKGTKCPTCIDSDDGPLPVYK
uniref:Putative secreted protein n=1 Tax=Panstrongylus lignarius TaxID=156445 RepID=A0A224XT64_9HEMI